MFYLAQTAGALYRQLHAAGYGPNQLRAVQKCFAFSNRTFSGVHHASGKPLICHLVGTASAVMAMDTRVEMVCAGLTHALFEPDVFQGERNPALLEAEFGPSVFRLIAAFGQFRWDDQAIAAFAAQSASANETFRSMLILRLANEMDDIANMGMGHALIRPRIEDCAKIAGSLGLRDAARTLELLIDEHEGSAAWAGALNPGTAAPFRVLPNFLTYLRLRLGRAGNLDVC